MKKKNKTNVITFYPFDDKTMLFAPQPTPATRSLPVWYKRQATTHENSVSLANGNPATTIKKCMPIFDAMTAGYILYAPCDIFIDATDPEKLTYSTPAAMKPFSKSLFASHSRDQYAEYPLDTKKYHKDLLRIHPLWVIGTDAGYSTLFIDPIHKDVSPLKMFDGIIDTDTFISDGYISFLVEKDFQGIIKQGTPLVQVIPFQREGWEMKVASSEEAEKALIPQRTNLRTTFFNGYKNKFRSSKDYK